MKMRWPKENSIDAPVLFMTVFLLSGAGIAYLLSLLPMPSIP